MSNTVDRILSIPLGRTYSSLIFRMETMITLRRLIKETPARVRRRAAETQTILVDSYMAFTRQGRPYSLATFRSKGWFSPKAGTWICQIRLFGNSSDVYTHQAWVRCNCPYFKFHSEVAISKRGSTTVKFSNGADPIVTNPKNQPRLCKHLFNAQAFINTINFDFRKPHHKRGPTP